MEALWINLTQYSEKKGIYFQQAYSKHILKDIQIVLLAKQLNHKKKI